MPRLSDVPIIVSTSSFLLPGLLISHRTQLLGNSCVDGAVPRHSIELALDISLAPHAYKGPCLLGRPARIHSRMRMQLLMASASHVRAYNHMT